MAKRGRPPKRETARDQRGALTAAWMHEWHAATKGQHCATARAVQATGRSRSQVKRDVAKYGPGARRAMHPLVVNGSRVFAPMRGIREALRIRDCLAPIGPDGERQWLPGLECLDDLPWDAAVKGWHAMRRKARRGRVKQSMATVLRDPRSRAELLTLIEAAVKN